MRLRDCQISREEISLSRGEVHSLGPHLALFECNLRVKVSAPELIVSGLHMDGGALDQDRLLRDFHFEHAKFNRVKFFGHFEGCDFGSWETSQGPSITECDFSKASLDGCRFLNCNPHNVRFPSWPFFALSAPSTLSSVELIDFPAHLRRRIKISSENGPECSFVVWDARRSVSDDFSIQDIRGFVARLPQAVIHD
jgi:hypothetical protein